MVSRIRVTRYNLYLYGQFIKYIHILIIHIDVYTSHNTCIRIKFSLLLFLLNVIKLNFIFYVRYNKLYFKLKITFM